MTTINLTDEQPDPALLKLCADALTAAAAKDYAGAGRVVEQLAREYPEQGAWVACQAWSDALITHTPGMAHRTDDAPIVLGFKNALTGEEGAADDVPAPVRWAGRFLMARARWDHDTAWALVQSCQNDAEFGAGVMALLEMVALGLTTKGHTHVVQELSP